jgi:hypothetical protein
MHSQHTLLDTTIEGYGVEDFVYSYFNNNAVLPGRLEDVVLLVASLKPQYKSNAISLNECVRQVRESWGECLGYVFLSDIKPGERELIKSMFEDVATEPDADTPAAG